MAASDVTRPALSTSIPSTGDLFDKLPERIFGALASQNRRTYWRVISRLYEDFFGPEVQAPPIDGYPIRTIQNAIEESLSRIDDWDLEDNESIDTPISVRANQLTRKLATEGWLTISRRGVREYALMRTEVLSFIGMLMGFVQAEPVFLSAKVRSIKVLLEAVYSGDGSGDQLNEAAAQSRQLIEYIRHMIGAISSLEATLRETQTAAEYVRTYFTQFIETHFIGDYRELRTRDHPLAERSHIVDMAESLSADHGNRERLLAWYCERRTHGNRDKAEVLFTRDIGRLLDFNRIDEYLLRLDQEVRRVNQRALATLDYRLRSTQRLDQLLQLATLAVQASPDVLRLVPFPPGDMISSDRLATPNRPATVHRAASLRDAVVSQEELAKAALRLRAREARTLTAPELAGFVRQHLGDAEEISGDELTFETIKDIRALQVLYGLAAASTLNSPKIEMSSRVMTRGFKVQAVDGDTHTTTFLTGTRFRIMRRRPLPIKQEKTPR